MIRAMNRKRIASQAPGDAAPSPRTTRRAGRPQATSREDIIACAIGILRKEPGAGVSINRIARTLGLTPMALYTYFSSHDELLQAVSAQLLDSVAIEVPATAGWRTKIACWAHGMRASFLRYPYLMHVLRWEGHISPSWLRQMLLVFEALEEAGLQGHEQARTALWVFTSIMGIIQAEIADIGAGMKFSDADFAQLEPDHRRWIRNFHDYASRVNYPDELFEHHLAHLIDNIAQDATSGSTSKAR
jgi:AcrR family transcriptional regulator